MKEKASSRIRYYENSQGPVIGTCNEKVIREDGLYFRDINGDGKLNTYKDWRKSPKERAKALAEDLSAEEKIGLLFLNSWKMGMEQEDKEILSFIKEKHSIVLLNKSDLAQQLSIEELSQFVPKEQILSISVHQGSGLDALMDAIKNMFFSGMVQADEDALLGNVRHKTALLAAREAMAHCLETIRTRMPEDFISMDLQDASRALGEITGDVADEEIIDRIFTKFCLGK